ncbi:MAG: RagB/SusD family nutrient uptake outer membrane protein [Leeuwenhoekiella sp.]|nr:MAG: RagB/SusD family nutrient uptake outer membrane protein [Leeuwenhoekiella sp.]
MNTKILLFLLAIVSLTGCDDLFEPAIENNRDLEDAYNDPTYAEGLLLNGYLRIPTLNWSFNDVATDDAVSNDIENAYRRAATGQWASNFDPFTQWQRSRAAIQYLNIFLSEADNVEWATDPNIDALYNRRLKGEAYGLRGLHMYYLLQSHAGFANGDLLGVPIILEPETPQSDFNLPRATFNACMTQLMNDLNQADEMLALDYEDISDPSLLPNGITNTNDFNRVFGERGRQRVSGRIVKAIKAQAALMAASPAYSDISDVNWDMAANYAGEVLALNGGISGIDDNGHTWYTNISEIADLGGGTNPEEILWRGDVGNSNNLESDHFPPTLNGDGRLNPTQNLVDAFPAVNGYPISDPASNYDPNDPYTNRDPRLRTYILVNRATAGVNGSTIITAADGTTNDALNAEATSTRTGYYMRKLLRQDVNLNTATTTQQLHYKPRIRYTELYLIYAEAANEAWGPTGTGSFGFSAYDVIAALRERAGITQPDAYLESIRGDKNAMRTLIRNERRLELCFEGFRFWDLRRWGLNLTETADGVSIVNGVHNRIEVEEREYQDYMQYGPVPYNETLKFDALEQNRGW